MRSRVVWFVGGGAQSDRGHGLPGAGRVQHGRDGAPGRSRGRSPARRSARGRRGFVWSRIRAPRCAWPPSAPAGCCESWSTRVASCSRATCWPSSIRTSSGPRWPRRARRFRRPRRRSAWPRPTRSPSESRGGEGGGGCGSRSVETATSRSPALAAITNAAVVDRLTAQLQKTRIVAPIAGTVTVRSVQPGETVEIGSSIVTVANLGRLRVEGEADEADASTLVPGAAVEVKADGYPGQTWRGLIEEVGHCLTLRAPEAAKDPSRPNGQRASLAVKVAFGGAQPAQLGHPFDETPPRLSGISVRLHLHRGAGHEGRGVGLVGLALPRASAEIGHGHESSFRSRPSRPAARCVRSRSPRSGPRCASSELGGEAIHHGGVGIAASAGDLEVAVRLIEIRNRHHLLRHEIPTADLVGLGQADLRLGLLNLRARSASEARSSSESSSASRSPCCTTLPSSTMTRSSRPARSRPRAPRRPDTRPHDPRRPRAERRAGLRPRLRRGSAVAPMLQHGPRLEDRGHDQTEPTTDNHTTRDRITVSFFRRPAPEVRLRSPPRGPRCGAPSIVRHDHEGPVECAFASPRKRSRICAPTAVSRFAVGSSASSTAASPRSHARWPRAASVPRQVAGQEMLALLEPDQVQRLMGALRRLSSATPLTFSAYSTFSTRQGREQVVLLEDEADRAPTHLAQPLSRPGPHLAPRNLDAAGGRGQDAAR